MLPHARRWLLFAGFFLHFRATAAAAHVAVTVTD